MWAAAVFPSSFSQIIPAARRRQTLASETDLGVTWAAARNECFNPTFAARPVARSSAAATQHNSGVDYSIILCDQAVGCVVASGSDFARNSLRESIPLLLDLIPLLFGCYSAVIS